MKIRKLTVWISIILTGIVISYLWIGFLFPDPSSLARLGLMGRIIFLWAPRILLPLGYLLLVIWALLKDRKFAQNIVVLFFTLLFLIILAYPVVDVFYFLKVRSGYNNITEIYHPYLQLSPPKTDTLKYHYGENTFKIFCLGGSTTEFTDSKGVGWPERIEKELRLDYNSDSIFVFNFGKQWYTTLHSLINYETNLRQYKPDVIILMHNINDLLQNADFSYFSKGEFREDYGHFYGPSAFIFEKMGLFGYIMEKLGSMWYHKPRISFEQDKFPGIESFKRNINTLIDLASMDNTKVILVTQPNILSENMDDKIKQNCYMVNNEAIGRFKGWGYLTAYQGMKQYNNKIRDISEERGVYFIDLEKYVPKSLTFFIDEVHYRDTTFTIISRSLVSEISRLNIIPK